MQKRVVRGHYWLRLGWPSKKGGCTTFEDTSYPKRKQLIKMYLNYSLSVSSHMAAVRTAQGFPFRCQSLAASEGSNLDSTHIPQRIHEAAQAKRIHLDSKVAASFSRCWWNKTAMAIRACSFGPRKRVVVLKPRFNKKTINLVEREGTAEEKRKGDTGGTTVHCLGTPAKKRSKKKKTRTNGKTLGAWAQNSGPASNGPQKDP